MRRYRGADKPPGPTMSPPPYSRRSSASNPRTGGSTRASTTRVPPASGLSIPENDLLMIQGSGAASAYLDPRTKKPIIPPAGRSVPKLKMSDLTSSLMPLIDNQIISSPDRAASLTDKRISLKGLPAKDMLESFDDAIRVPDMRAINSKVAQLRKKTSYVGKGSNASLSPKSRVSTDVQSSKSSAKSEEKSVRKLMGQLRDKYLEDMESQLGLAIERRPKPSLMGNYDQSGEGDIIIPRPSTDARDITTRIDKVVREWATESQRFNKLDRNKSSGAYPQKQSNSTTLVNKSPSVSPKTSKKRIPNTIMQQTPAKNKNLAKISSAFRKSLDPISKRDVRELIKVPEDDVAKLEEEHEERVRAHEAVFRNVVISNSNNNSTPGKDEKVIQKKSEPKISSGSKRASSKADMKNSEKPQQNPESQPENRAKPIQVNQKLKPFAEAIGLAKDDENEVYNIIKDHMNYEMASGAPKISAPSIRKQNTGTSSKTSMLRSDAVGKALEKYGDSHKKLHSLVSTFTTKVDSSRKTIGTDGTKHRDSDSSDDVDNSHPPPRSVTSLASQSTLDSRRENSAAVKLSLSKSIKTIDRASSVAQRLGTLMSRVALRNEAYDYEKQQEAKQKSISVSLDSPESTSSSQPTMVSNSIRRLSTPNSLAAPTRSNPYEQSIDGPNIPPGVSKMDSKQFGKYVDEMKKVAQKAAASFEKFKEQKEDTELVSFSEDEEDSEAEYSYQSDDDAYYAAAAAAEIAAQQEESRKKAAKAQENSRKQQITHSKQQAKPVKTVKTSVSKTLDTISQASSPREMGLSTGARTSSRSTGMNTAVGTSTDHNNNVDFKFVPDMSYTDQLMLQKLRKLKESEGWGDISNEGIDAVGDVPDQGEIASILQRTKLEQQKETERASMGPVSLNAILRSRLNKSSNNSKK